MWRSRIGVASLIAGILMMSGTLAVAQVRNATLSGVVLGMDGKPVANASVTYQSGGGVAPHVVKTDDKGRFSISKLRADIYDVRASAQGVYSEWQKNVNVRPGQTKTLTLRLTHAKDTRSVAPPEPSGRPSKPLLDSRLGVLWGSNRAQLAGFLGANFRMKRCRINAL